MSHAYTGFALFLFPMSSISKEKQHWAWQWGGWLRIPWAALPGWFISLGLRFIPKRPVWGWLAGCHGACLLAQGTILGPTGRISPLLLLITFYVTQCRQMWLTSLSCLLSGRHGVGPGELRCMYRPVAEQTKVSWRETLHHQLAKPSRRCSNLCGRGQCKKKKRLGFILYHTILLKHVIEREAQ